MHAKIVSATWSVSGKLCKRCTPCGSDLKNSKSRVHSISLFHSLMQTGVSGKNVGQCSHPIQENAADRRQQERINQADAHDDGLPMEPLIEIGTQLDSSLHDDIQSLPAGVSEHDVLCGRGKLSFNHGRCTVATSFFVGDLDK
jgi:hypothetical protein